VLEIDVTRFEPVGASARRAELVARWTLRSSRDHRVLAQSETKIAEPLAAGSKHSDEVAALSRALARFASTLASAVAQHNQQASR
jgi:hypothetical protein